MLPNALLVDGDCARRCASRGVMDMTELEALLEEWGEWATYEDELIGPALPRCLSLEGGYVPPQWWDWPDPKRDEPDWRIGERVEAAWRTLDNRGKAVLKAWYIVSQWALPEHERREYGKRLRLTAMRTCHAEATVEQLLDVARVDMLRALSR